MHIKKTLTLLPILSVTLLGCTNYGSPPYLKSHDCREIIRKMHSTSPFYPWGHNKKLVTIQAKLLQDYQYYHCNSHN